MSANDPIVVVRVACNILIMDTEPRPRIVLLIVGALTFAVAISSVSLARVVGDPIESVFQLQITGLTVLGVLVWAVASLTARRLFVGKFPSEIVKSRVLILWGGFRFVLLLAIVLDLVIWLVSVALGLEMSNTFLRGLVLLIVFSAFLGIAGGAFLNSFVTIRHWRRA